MGNILEGIINKLNFRSAKICSNSVYYWIRLKIFCSLTEKHLSNW
ncbi:hypothetical protein DesLBE_3782 [Desulfitobacterium sp. LBE]|nr:hypothetical protein DesLBE_3782 [Desulfitobacterium sp. LBE]